VDVTQASTLFEGFDTCSTPSIRNMLRSLPFEFLNVTPNPTAGSVDAFIRHSLTVGDEMSVFVTDLSGKKLWTSSINLPAAPEAHLLITFPDWVASGTYMLTLEASGYAASRQIVVAR